ncbi:MAG: tRNA (adenosine(37)-N6)-threonylcarbamoyltransferase complex ATPase subunit type 1 TsaE [Dehalococcoidia bacterium]|nr:tRNA (adenosine(37)-N6)-threonylcarbamoyltransferase complex ATPase subunit type 1 TsaE [Dehalococcoidia bacterium]
MSFTITSHSPDETAEAGAALGRLLQPGDVVLLQGDLGAGKTRLTQGLARAAGSPDPVTSPTFVLVNEYHGPLRIVHVDLYRIERAVDADSLGLDEYLEGEGVTVVEWPEQAPDALPADHLLIAFDHAGAFDRTLTITGFGDRYRALAQTLAAALAVLP